jgi:hypothetical protein
MSTPARSPLMAWKAWRFLLAFTTPEGTARLFREGECVDGALERTNISLNDAFLMNGRVHLDCPLESGGRSGGEEIRIVGQLEFCGCR